MSLFGALNTAVSGLTSQSNAFSNIGDDVANSQTTGFKRIDTRFTDYLTTSTAATNQSGAVVARPEYINNVQGSVTQTDNPLSLAITGNGFFAVNHPVGDAYGVPVFKLQTEYTRAGDFSLNKDNYMVNGSGDFLSGWPANTAGVVDTSKIVPIKVSQAGFNPVPTSNATLAANLPASPDGAPINTQVPVIDTLGRQQTLNLAWSPISGSPNTWSVSVSQEGAASPLGTATVTFGSAGNPAASEGTVGNVTATSGAVTGSTYAAGASATIGISANFGAGAQPLTLNLGHFGQTDGLTQFAGTSYSLRSLTQNGVKPGNYTGVSLNPNGDVVTNYDNGQSRVQARIPLTTFSNPNGLQRQDGQTFTETRESGQAQVEQAGNGGAGSLVTGSVESSNVDIATEFTKLIVAQRAYSANTKLITTADELLTSTINLKQ